MKGHVRDARRVEAKRLRPKQPPSLKANRVYMPGTRLSHCPWPGAADARARQHCWNGNRRPLT